MKVTWQRREPGFVLPTRRLGGSSEPAPGEEPAEAVGRATRREDARHRGGTPGAEGGPGTRRGDPQRAASTSSAPARCEAGPLWGRRQTAETQKATGRRREENPDPLPSLTIHSRRPGVHAARTVPQGHLRAKANQNQLTRKSPSAKGREGEGGKSELLRRTYGEMTRLILNSKVFSDNEAQKQQNGGERKRSDVRPLAVWASRLRAMPPRGPESERKSQGEMSPANRGAV